MSTDEHGRGEMAVTDDENYVDRRRKEMILERRESVDTWKKELFLRVRTDDLEEAQAVALYGDRVRDYLIAVEPLLREGDLPGATEVYEEKEIGTVVVEPPEKWVEAADFDVREAVGAAGRDLPEWVVVGDSPEPKEVPFNGIKDVIEGEAVTQKWDLELRRPPGNHAAWKSLTKSKTVTATATPPRALFRDAVRVVDGWLQKIDVGVEVGRGGLPAEMGFDQTSDSDSKLTHQDQNESPEL